MSNPHVPREAVLPHIEKLTASGMSYILIARRGGLAHSTVAELARGVRETCSAESARRILSVQPGHFDNISQQPALATTRRMQALYALGHHRESIRAAGGNRITFTAISSIANGLWQSVDGSTAEAVETAYNKLGGCRGTCAKAQVRAARLGWAPPIAWDDDAIDDPSAHADWTGHCGTDRGWWLHRANNIPTCKPCAQAHDEWRDQHKHLDSKQRWAAASKARSAAASRGIAIAANARELFDQGYTPEQAALRLGVGKDRIEHELRRHPDATNYEEAA